MHRPKSARNDLPAAIGCTAVVGAAMGATWPLLSLKMEFLGLSSLSIGVSASAQALSVLLVFPIAPRIIKTFGVKRTAAYSILAAALAVVLFSLFESAYAWTPIRVFLGMSVAIVFIASETWFMATVPPAKLGVLGGVFGLVWSTAFASGPLMLLVVGTHGSLPFIILATVVSAGLCPLALAHERTEAADGPEKVWMMALIAIAPVAILSALIQGLLDSINDSFVPLYGLRHGLTVNGSVSLLAVVLLGLSAAQIPVGMLADRFPPRALIAVIGSTIAIAAICLPLTIGSSWLLWPNALILGAGVGSLWVVSLVMVAMLFPAAQLAHANTARSMLYGLGSAAGPLIAGAGIDRLGGSFLPYLIAFLGVALGLLAGAKGRNG